MEQNKQIFLQLDAERTPIEFLLLDQPFEIITAGVVTKQQVRETVEKGFQHPNETFTRVDQYGTYRLLVYITVEIDTVLRYVKKVEQHIE